MTIEDKWLWLVDRSCSFLIGCAAHLSLLYWIAYCRGAIFDFQLSPYTDLSKQLVWNIKIYSNFTMDYIDDYDEVVHQDEQRAA